MKYTLILLLLIGIFGLFTVETPVAASIIPQTTLSPPTSEQNLDGSEKNESAPNLIEADSGRALGILGNLINFPDNSKDKESPAVAHCASDQYLVVFQHDNDIYGQRLSQSGELIDGPFRISNGSQKSSNPDVACEWMQNVFVVTWEYDYYGNGNDYDIRARAILGSRSSTGENFFTVETAVSDTNSQEKNPAIACTSDNMNCLIVFEYGDTSGAKDIFGRRLIIRCSGIDMPYDVINISKAFEHYNPSVNEQNPDVVWSSNRNEYMLVWEYDFGDRYQIVHAAVHDTHQAGLQYKPGLHVLFNNQGGQSNPAVAYSYRSDQYLVAFENLYNDTKLVYIKGIGGGSAFRLGEQMDIPMVNPAVAYSGGTVNLPGGMGEDQFLVLYVSMDTSTTKLVSHAFSGIYVNDNPQSVGGPVELFSTGSGENFGIGTSNITGSAYSGNYLAVWEKYSEGFAGLNFDILGRMISSERPLFQLEVTTTGSGSGVITSTPAGINCGSSCSASFDKDASVTLTATADADSTFAGWSGACLDTNNTCVVTMDQARSVVAYFDYVETPSTKQYLPLIFH